MNMRISKKKFPAYAFAIVPLLLLSACAPLDWIKEKLGGSGSKGTAVAMGDAGQVLASMDGKPLVTMEQFDKDFNQLLEENPGLKSVLPFVPDAKANFLAGLVSQKMVDSYVNDHQISARDDYKQEYARGEQALKRALNTKYFGL